MHVAILQNRRQGGFNLASLGIFFLAFHESKKCGEANFPCKENCPTSGKFALDAPLVSCGCTCDLHYMICDIYGPNISLCSVAECVHNTRPPIRRNIGFDHFNPDGHR